jgi:hypothetical protein
MVQEIFNNCLFALPTERDYASTSAPISITKCKTHASRSMALNLLAQLGKDCLPNFIELIKLLKPHHITPEMPKSEDGNWDNPKIFEKSSAGYVGLKNLGSICYVNSLMQQFFMIPTVRDSLIQLDVAGKRKPFFPCYFFVLTVLFQLTRSLKRI